jgi:hypothetical protein
MIRLPELAQSGREKGAARCPLSEVKRTSAKTFAMSAFDPKATSITWNAVNRTISKAVCRTGATVVRCILFATD